MKKKEILKSIELNSAHLEIWLIGIAKFIDFVTQVFIKFSKNANIQKLKAWFFKLSKNDLCTVNNNRVRSLQSSVLPVLYTHA